MPRACIRQGTSVQHGGGRRRCWVVARDTQLGVRVNGCQCANTPETVLFCLYCLFPGQGGSCCCKSTGIPTLSCSLALFLRFWRLTQAKLADCERFKVICIRFYWISCYILGVWQRLVPSSRCSEVLVQVCSRGLFKFSLTMADAQVISDDAVDTEHPVGHGRVLALLLFSGCCVALAWEMRFEINIHVITNLLLTTFLVAVGWSSAQSELTWMTARRSLLMASFRNVYFFYVLKVCIKRVDGDTQMWV